jgi:selenocysteine lyase/cysteine desulfurase
LCARAGQAGLEVFSSRLPEERSGIVSLVAPEADPRALVRRCRGAGIVINQRAGRLRVSPHCYNTQAEIDRLVEFVRCHRSIP